MLVLELKKHEVIVLNTADGLVVVRLQEDMPPTKLGIEAPKSVNIYRDPVSQHPVQPKSSK